MGTPARNAAGAWWALAAILACGPGVDDVGPPTRTAPLVERFQGEAGGDLAWPEGWPEEIPLCDGARPGAHVRAEGGGTLFILLCDESRDALLLRYAEALRRLGWNDVVAQKVGPAPGLAARRGPARLRAAAYRSGAGSRLELAYGPVGEP